MQQSLPITNHHWVISPRHSALNDVSALIQLQCVGQVGSRRVPRAERSEVPACFNQLEDRGGVVCGVVDEMPFSEWGDDDRGHACPWPPAVDFWGRNMIPNAAVTGIGHDDNRIIPNKALLDFVDNQRGVLVTSSDI